MNRGVWWATVHGVTRELDMTQPLNSNKFCAEAEIPICLYMGFLCGSASKESSCNVGDLNLIPRLGRSPEEEKGYPLQYSGLKKFHGLYCPWGHKESDTTESLTFLLYTTRKCLGLIYLTQTTPRFYRKPLSSRKHLEGTQGCHFAFFHTTGK